MEKNSALCLYFDIDLVQTGFNSNRLEILEKVTQAAGHGGRIQFSSDAANIQGLEPWLANICKAGHGLDLALNIPQTANIGEAAGIEPCLHEMSQAFRQARLSWWGACLTGETKFVPDHGQAAARVLMDAGARWLCAEEANPSEKEFLSPCMLASDLVYIPGYSPFEAGTNANPAAPDQVWQKLESILNDTARNDRIQVLSFRLSQWVAFDPQEIMLRRLIALADQLRIPRVTLNEISDVTLAYAQAEPQALERVSMRQQLQFKNYWDNVLGPSQQAYKTYDYRGGWRLKPGYYRRGTDGWEILSEPDPEKGYPINQHGFRGEMFPHQKPTGEKRVLMVGDSCVFGIGGDRNPWPAQAQIRLDELSGPGKLRIMNAGIEGQSSVHCLMRLERLLTFDPDFVLVAVFGNDLFIENPAEYLDTSGQAYATAWEIMGEFPHEHDIPKLVSGQRRSMTLEDFYPFSFAYHLRQIVQTCRMKGVPAALMTLPCLFPADRGLTGPVHRSKMHTPPFLAQGDMAGMRRLYDIYNGAIRIVAKDEKVGLVDGEDFFASSYDDQRGTLFSDTCHPTSAGNILLGRYAGEELWKLIQ